MNNSEGPEFDALARIEFSYQEICRTKKENKQ